MKPPTYNSDWPPEVQALYRHDMQEMWDPTLAPHIWSQYHNQLEIYLSLVAGEEKIEVLDVGCAQGTLALLLAEQGHSVCAVDIRQHFLDYAVTRYERGRVRFLQGNAENINFDRTFDLIYCNQMLEHVPRPGAVISRLRSLLKDGGRLVVTTPNHDYLVSRLPSFNEVAGLPTSAERQNTADSDGHYFAYTKRELETLIREAGFRMIETRFFETPWVSGHMKVRHVFKLIPGRVRKAVDRALLSLPLVSATFGHQLLAVARIG